MRGGAVPFEPVVMSRRDLRELDREEVEARIGRHSHRG
jgi:hypothetical protein